MGREQPTARDALNESIENAFLALDSKLPGDREALEGAYRRSLDPLKGDILLYDGDPASIDQGQLVRFLDQHLRILKILEMNKGVGPVNRFVSDLSSAVHLNGELTTHGCIELRDQQGRSIALDSNRFFPLEEGSAILHIRVYPVPNDLRIQIENLISPRAYSSALETLRSLSGEAPDWQALEKDSLIFSRAHANLVSTYGGAIPRHRDLKSVKSGGDNEQPFFVLGYRNGAEFIIRPEYSPETCRLEVPGRLAGQP